MAEKILLYTRFERFWHCTQAILIVLLGITGFEIHGSFHFIGFERAVHLHDDAAWILAGLVVFAIFWHFTTGEWRQYLPARDMIRETVRFYLVGIFRGEPHPFPKSRARKLNPLQRFTYLFLKLILFPLQFVTGFLYLFSNDWPNLGITADLESVALLHTAGAFAFIVFFVVHVYLTTTGKTPLAHIKAILTGWEEADRPPA